MQMKLEGFCPLLQVFDMPASLAFYRDVLGFELVHAVPAGDHCDWCLLRLGTAELMLNTQYERGQRPPAADASRTAAHADTTLYFACSDLVAAQRQLQAHGLALVGPVDRDYGMRQLSFEDPDGYAVCLQWPIS
jgi:glyoxylase I family protein